MKSLGLYIHIPYCLNKCGYCDFNSHLINLPEMEIYIDALLQELSCYSKKMEKQSITSIFLGGGTPTTLPSHHLEAILDQCRKIFLLEPGIEITLEANPAKVTLDELLKIREAGYNRISIGAQSFHEHELQQLERAHGTKEIFLTVNQARESGFDNLSLDLIFGLPHQTSKHWAASLDQAIALSPEHLSTYNLTIEPGTAFYVYQTQGRLSLPDDEHQLSLYKETIQKLLLAGYEHYEISNFTKPGKECQHNINYWNNGDYLGLGAGASSFLQGTRFKNIERPGDYIREITRSGSAIHSQEQVNLQTSMGETLMLGLRLRGGVQIESFEQRFHISFEQTYRAILNSLLSQDLICFENGYLFLTEKGLFIADSVIMEFLPESGSLFPGVLPLN